MGYADPNQVGSGLRQRLYSRAFIIGNIQKPEDRFVYLVLDTQSGDTAVRHGILEGLSGLGGEYNLYGSGNVAVIGTHSHSGPGAWLNYLLPQITSKGFDKQSYQAIVDGALLSRGPIRAWPQEILVFPRSSLKMQTSIEAPSRTWPIQKRNGQAIMMRWIRL